MKEDRVESHWIMTEFVKKTQMAFNLTFHRKLTKSDYIAPWISSTIQFILKCQNIHISIREITIASYTWFYANFRRKRYKYFCRKNSSIHLTHPHPVIVSPYRITNMRNLEWNMCDLQAVGWMTVLAAWLWPLSISPLPTSFPLPPPLWSSHHHSFELCPITNRHITDYRLSIQQP